MQLISLIDACPSSDNFADKLTTPKWGVVAKRSYSPWVVRVTSDKANTAGYLSEIVRVRRYCLRRRTTDNFAGIVAGNWPIGQIIPSLCCSPISPDTVEPAWIVVVDSAQWTQWTQCTVHGPATLVRLTTRTPCAVNQHLMTQRHATRYA